MMGRWSRHTGSLKVVKRASSLSCSNRPLYLCVCWSAGCSPSGPGSVTSGEKCKNLLFPHLFYLPLFSSYILFSGSSNFIRCTSCPVNCPHVTSWATEPNTWGRSAQWSQLQDTLTSWGVVADILSLFNFYRCAELWHLSTDAKAFLRCKFRVGTCLGV